MISYLMMMMMMMGMVRMMELNKLLLLTLLFLLYHICCHSFLKSCYLKKCFHFCALSLFSFFSAFKTGRHLANVTYLSEGVVWPLEGDMQKCKDKRCRISAHPWTKLVFLLIWESDVFASFQVNCFSACWAHSWQVKRLQTSKAA